MSVVRTIVHSSRALVTTAKDAARFREIAQVFITHGFGWVVAQLRLRRELGVEHEGEGPDIGRAGCASCTVGAERAAPRAVWLTLPLLGLFFWRRRR